MSEAEKKKKNKIDFESDEKRDEVVKEIIGFFQDERGEEIGILAAQNLLDFFLQTLGEEVYRKAIKDVKKLLKEKVEDLEVELDILSTNE